MAKAILVFEDAPDGKVSFKITHAEGFDKFSNAHKLSMQVCKFLDDQCAAKEDVEAEQATPEEKQFAAAAGAIGQSLPLILVPR